ncbi:hypothetical protein [Aneurinibacillus terranovensis]|uniref:hypothetical protein n=1 Tax=Aneurinibacillus terranovensis TaxID=278991 RepID=UPI00041115E6|nr:hypothetical protein [Aneurinibacillus terranovensis]
MTKIEKVIVSIISGGYIGFLCGNGRIWAGIVYFALTWLLFIFSEDKNRVNKSMSNHE